MSEMPPILVADLFPVVSRPLLDPLRLPTTDQCEPPTPSSPPKVKDNLSHLAERSLRRLSLQRDGYSPPNDHARPQPGEPLVAFLARLNDEWEVGTRRLS